jgi:multidrug efflux pump subunit AcrA (membrane-fusion protein)
LLGVGVMVVLLAAYLLWPRPQVKPQAGAAFAVSTAKAAVGALVHTIRVAGQSSARNYALMTIPVFRGPDSRGNLTLLKLAKAGSMVKKGDIVAQMDTQSARDHIDDAEDSVEQSMQDIYKRKAEQGVDWGNLQQTLRVARSDQEKATLEYRTAEVKTDLERELLRLNLDEAQAKYKQQEADVAATRTSDQAELRILEITNQRNKIHLDRHLFDIDKFDVKAPMSGLAVMQQIFRGAEMALIQEGDQVSAGQPIMKIVDPNSMQVEAAVNQSESSQLRIGQTATVGLDAFPELRFRGRVYSIGALAVRGWRESFYVRSVPVRIAIEGSDSRLIPDLSAWADVEVGRSDSVMVIPREAARTEGGQTVLYVRGSGGFERREVSLGAASYTHVAVLSGLRPGEEVALSRP